MNEIVDEVSDLIGAIPGLEEGQRPEAQYQEKYEAYYQELMQIIDTLIHDSWAGELELKELESIVPKPDSEWWLV